LGNRTIGNVISLNSCNCKSPTKMTLRVEGTRSLVGRIMQLDRLERPLKQGS